MKIPEVKVIDIGLLKTDDQNPNKMDVNKFFALKNNLKKFGFIVPIITNKEYLIADGEHRWNAARELGMKEVPVVALDVDEVDRRLLRQIMNKLKGEHDNKKDAEEYQFILEHDDQAVNKFMQLLAQEEIDVQGLIEKEFPPVVEEDDFDADAAEIKENPVVKIGEVWQLGHHRLMCGDSIKKTDVDILMNSALANVVFTDPPYGMFLDTDFSSMEGIAKGNKYKKVEGDNDDFTPELITTIFSNFNYCKEIFVWGADYFAELVPKRNQGSWIVWDKMNNGEGVNDAYDKMFGSNFELCWSKAKHKRAIARVLWKGIFGLSEEDTKKRLHPTQKPLKLVDWFLTKFSKKGHIVADLYGGSGATIIASEKLGRICYTMEIDPYYCDVIIARWEKLTGKEAVKL